MLDLVYELVYAYLQMFREAEGISVLKRDFFNVL